MKKTLLIVAAVVMMLVISADFAFAVDEIIIDQPAAAEEMLADKPAAAEEKAAAGEATEEKATAEKEEEQEGWKPYVEVSAEFRNLHADDYSGEMLYKSPLLTQTATVGMEYTKKVGKDAYNKAGFYIRADNFIPSGGENHETDPYFGVNAEIKDWKFDIGYGRYLNWEHESVDFNGLFFEITAPALIWDITPFIKGEYRFSERIKNEEDEGISQNGFLYYVGLKREFELHKRISLVLEVGFGGHTGIYGMPAENISFAREKLEIKISLVEWMKAEAKFKASVMTQQNLGLRDGIAADTEKLFVSGGIAVEY